MYGLASGVKRPQQPYLHHPFLQTVRRGLARPIVWEGLLDSPLNLHSEVHVSILDYTHLLSLWYLIPILPAL